MVGNPSMIWNMESKYGMISFHVVGNATTSHYFYVVGNSTTCMLENLREREQTTCS